MAPKSSDDDKIKDGSSRDYKLTTSMDSDETLNPDDSDETEGDKEEGDEDSEETELVKRNSDDSDTELEWGYDSFDEYEDNLSDQNADSNDEVEMQWRHCQRQVNESKGFFKVTDEFPPCVYSGIGSLGDLDQPAMEGFTVRQLCENLTCLCLDRFNYDKEQNVTLDHIIRVNFNPGSMTKFYITFAARESDSPDAPFVEYQAKAVYSVAHKSYPILCRPSPTLKS